MVTAFFLFMTSIAKELTPSEIADMQYSKTRCHVCNFPAGKHRNNFTGEIVRVFFYKAAGGKYVCNLCVESERGHRVAKWDKKSRKALKQALKGGIYAEKEVENKV